MRPRDPLVITGIVCQSNGRVGVVERTRQLPCPPLRERKNPLSVGANNCRKRRASIHFGEARGIFQISGDR
jgi:hypothetical protein